MQEYNRLKRRRLLVSFLTAHAEKLIILCVVAGVLNFFILGIRHPSILQGVFCSENALLPHQVSTQYSQDDFSYVVSKYNEAQELKFGNRTQWLLSQFTQYGLVPFVHEYPCVYSKTDAAASSPCTNVYAILHAPRGDGTDALVLSSSWINEATQKENLAGVLMTLSLAKFWRKYSYWAKDVIFLISPDLQGGDAWIHHYFAESVEKPMVHAGEIQAALHLDVPDMYPNQLEIDYTGYHGQVPNLDYISIVRTIARGFKMPLTRHGPEPEDYVGTLQSLLRELHAQLHTPTSIHGTFRHYGVHALTLRGTHQPGLRKVASYVLPGMVESTFRSLNNLIERFHAGYFLYLLATPGLFLSMTVYLPMIGLFCGAFLISAFLHFHFLPAAQDGRTWMRALGTFLMALGGGVVARVFPPASFFFSVVAVVVGMWPDASVPHTVFLRGLTRMALGVVLLCVSLVHFALGLLYLAILLPLDFLLPALPSRGQWVLWFATHPLLLTAVAPWVFSSIFHTHIHTPVLPAVSTLLWCVYYPVHVTWAVSLPRRFAVFPKVKES